jgi:hypothetical protein
MIFRVQPRVYSPPTFQDVVLKISPGKQPMALTVSQSTGPFHFSRPSILLLEFLLPSLSLLLFLTAPLLVEWAFHV